MSVAKLQVVPPEAVPTPSPDALTRTRELTLDAIDALTLLSKGDFSSADAALKRAMLAAHEARQAISPSLLGAAPAPSGGDVTLTSEGWTS